MLRLRTFGMRSIEIPFSEAAAGDILCSDNKIVASSDYSVSGKTAIGIVFNNTSGTLRIMALNTVTEQWGGYGTNLTGLDDITTEQAAIADIDGESNTSAMFNEISGDTIALKASYYSVTGATSGWYLGAIGEIYLIGQKLSEINAARQAIGIATIGLYVVMVSSTEYDAENCWYGYTGTGTFSINSDLAKNLTIYPTYPILKKTY